MNSAVEIKNLKFSYGAQEILNISEFSVKPSEFIFLYGASGSGKSTLLEMLAGVLEVQTGELHILGQQLHKKSSSQLDLFRAQNIGYIFQSFNLIPYLSVAENIQLPLMFLQKKLDPAYFEHLIKCLELGPYLSRRVTDLSVGQQQRVAVARALMKRPPLILADEPTSALDYNQRENFLKLLFQVCEAEKTTVVFVSHDRTIEKLFHRSISLESINAVHPQTEIII